MNGLHLVFLLIVGATLLVSIRRLKDLRSATTVVMLPLWFLICSAIASFLAGACVLGFKTHRYFTDGHWPSIDIAWVIDWLGAARPVAATGWTLDILSSDAVVTLMVAFPASLWVPFSAALIVVAHVISASSPQPQHAGGREVDRAAREM